MSQLWGGNFLDISDIYQDFRIVGVVFVRAIHCYTEIIFLKVRTVQSIFGTAGGLLNHSMFILKIYYYEIANYSKLKGESCILLNFIVIKHGCTTYLQV